MRQLKRYALSAVVALPVLYFAGCRNALQIPVRLTLPASMGQFQLTAGETVQNAGTLPGNSLGRTVGSGTFSIKPEDITFTPEDNGTGKGTTTYQAGGSFTITAGIAAGDEVDTVCDDPVDEYGPFTVTLDEDGNVESISPSSVDIESTTIDLINAGEISVCLTVTSTVDGTVTIEALSLNLGL